MAWILITQTANFTTKIKLRVTPGHLIKVHT